MLFKAICNPPLMHLFSTNTKLHEKFHLVQSICLYDRFRNFNNYSEDHSSIQLICKIKGSQRCPSSPHLIKGSTINHLGGMVKIAKKLIRKVSREKIETGSPRKKLRQDVLQEKKLKPIMGGLLNMWGKFCPNF